MKPELEFYNVRTKERFKTSNWNIRTTKNNRYQAVTKDENNNKLYLFVPKEFERYK